MGQSPTVLLAGPLDTKTPDMLFVRECLRSAGVTVLLADFGVGAGPDVRPDITREQVAGAAGADVRLLAEKRDKAAAMEAMARGLAAVVRTLWVESRIDGMISLGGTSSTAIATAAMRYLPVGVPKVMVSTVASADSSAYTGGRDIVMIPSIVDVAGVNRISRPIYRNAAHCLAGMVLHRTCAEASQPDKPLVAASMFGNTTPCIERARTAIENAGCEVVVFHATGSGGRTMQSLASDGLLAGLLDLTTTELADEVCGGVFTAGPGRTRMAADTTCPVVLAPGCVDMCNFGTPETVPDRHRSRNLYRWNPNVTLMRTNAEENHRIGEMIAETANQCAGPAVVLLPLGGVSMLDSKGQPFWDPEADEACYQAIRQNLRTEIRCLEIDANINDPVFADRAATELLSALSFQIGDTLGVHTTGNTAAAETDTRR